jgi:PKD repeat protein
MNTSTRFPRCCLAFAVTSLLMTSAHADNAAVTVNVDANAGKHPISPYIYGVAFAPDSATLADLNAPLNRQGGNNASRYNWKINASNHDFDWYFESIDEGGATPGLMGDNFIATSRAAGAQPMLTIPMLDWVAKLGANRSKLASFSQAKYGAQTGADWQWMPDAGNGVLASNGQNIVGNDPNDANVPAGVAFQQSWVQHLVAKWGLAASGGLKFYILDNEHSIWQGTHRDVHPVGATEGEIRQKMIDYSNMIKAADPGAIVVGPEEWGWSGYFYSGYDQQYGAAHGWCCYPDRAANGNMDYMPWLLDQLHKYDVANGKHVLDVFSLHYYPQSGEYGDDVSTSMQLTRNRSTRSLWDPNYVDTSWIGDKIYLIPRMKNWVATYYPGLKLAITEYNWGAEGHINGATAQADVYGIFGREGIDYATRWTTPGASTPTYKAMKMYRNYDGAKHGFGDTSVSASAPNPDNVSAFAATRGADGALTVMVISKVLSGNTPVTLKLANFAPGPSAEVWQLTSANAITRLANVAVGAGSVTATVPAQSVTLFVIPRAASPQPVANFSYVTIGLTANFTDSSTDSSGTIAAHAWTFGDGGTSSSTNPSHFYSAAGNYNVTETVTDNHGATSRKTSTVTVSNSGGTQLLVNTGFETGTASPWAVSAGVLQNNSALAHSGSWFARISDRGASGHVTVVLQSVTLPGDKAEAVLSFYLHTTTAETTTSTRADVLFVRIYGTDGTLLATLAIYSNLDATGGYVLRNLDMSPYVGKTVRVEFVGANNGTLGTTWDVDDVTVRVH